MKKTQPGLTFAVTLLACGLFVAGTVFLGPSIGFAQDKTDSAKSKDTPKADSASSDKSAKSATDFMKAAREKIVSYESVKAKVIQQVSIGGSRFRAVGKYMQGQGDKVRLEYVLESLKQSQDKVTADKPAATKTKTAAAAPKTNGMTQISDGEVMYTVMKIGGKAQASRVNVKEIQNVAKTIPGRANSDGLQDLGLGGVKSMLVSFQETMKFSDRQTETLGDTEYVRLTGTWKAEQRRKIAGEGAEEDQVLPGYIPDYIRLYFDQKTMFLRRVVYLKKHPTENKIRPMVTLDFIDVVINGPVSQSDFTLAKDDIPDKVTPIDQTEAVIKQLEASAKGASQTSPVPTEEKK